MATLTERFQSIRQSQGNEAAVRAVWHPADIAWRKELYLKNAHSADLTAERLKAIEKKQEEVGAVQRKLESVTECGLEYVALTWQRILAVLEQQLTELQRGMRAKFLNGEVDE